MLRRQIQVKKACYFSTPDICEVNMDVEDVGVLKSDGEVSDTRLSEGLALPRSDTIGYCLFRNARNATFIRILCL